MKKKGKKSQRPELLKTEQTLNTYSQLHFGYCAYPVPVYCRTEYNNKNGQPSAICVDIFVFFVPRHTDDTLKDNKIKIQNKKYQKHEKEKKKKNEKHNEMKRITNESKAII